MHNQSSELPLNYVLLALIRYQSGLMCSPGYLCFFAKEKNVVKKRKFNKQENVLKIELRSSTTLRSVWLKSHRQIAEHHF